MNTLYIYSIAYILEIYILYYIQLLCKDISTIYSYYVNTLVQLLSKGIIEEIFENVCPPHILKSQRPSTATTQRHYRGHF